MNSSATELPSLAGPRVAVASRPFPARRAAQLGRPDPELGVGMKSSIGREWVICQLKCCERLRYFNELFLQHFFLPSAGMEAG